MTTTNKIEFKRLKKWENDLNKCIRCGYCYQLCPLYKTKHWESDTPRGKLILLHGLITNKINLTKEIAEKLFQCFYCEQCGDNCSAGVHVTEIFTDARADFEDAGFIADGTTSKFKEDLCSSCGMCVSVCKTEALTFSEDDLGNRKVIIDRVKCEGCGLCIATCPSKVIYQKEGFEISNSELKENITNLVKNEGKKLVVFVCNWSIYPGLQNSKLASLINDTYGIIVTMCVGRVTPELILHSFKEGAWGVMINGCPADECEHDANYLIRKKANLFKKLLEEFNVESKRIRMGWFSNGKPMELLQSINDFSKYLEKLGPIKETKTVSNW